MVLQSAAMPVSVENSKILYEALKQSGVKIISALPETWLVHLINMAEADPETTLVRLTREEEAIGISAGAHLAGVRSALLMQNHGFLAAINPIVSLSFLYKIPLLMLISYRGHIGERDPWQTQGGRFTEPVLKALAIPYDYLTNPAHVARQISDAHALAESSLTPVALLLSRQLMWEV
jgi:sulfopyruvate decarboxylase subunit alpha